MLSTNRGSSSVHVSDQRDDSTREQPEIEVSNQRDDSTRKQPEIESTGISEIDNDEHWPLSGKPYVGMILTESSVKPTYSLYIPKKMNKELPFAGAPVVLTCGRKTWEMFYAGVDSNYKINIGWKKFVDDNNLKEGDGLVFELSECSADKIYFRVQILRSDLPAGLIPEGEEGASSNYPIVID